MKNRQIHIDHQLQRARDMEYIIEDTKTTSGTHVIPIIDSHAGFLCLDKNGMPMVALHWEKYMEHVVAKYNKTYRVQLPKVTAISA